MVCGILYTGMSNDNIEYSINVYLIKILSVKKIQDGR